MADGNVYEIVGYCDKTQKAYVSPISWFGQSKAPGSKSFEVMERPTYSTCKGCCPEKITGSFLEKQAEKRLKNRKKGNVNGN